MIRKWQNRRQKLDMQLNVSFNICSNRLPLLGEDYQFKCRSLSACMRLPHQPSLSQVPALSTSPVFCRLPLYHSFDSHSTHPSRSQSVLYHYSINMPIQYIAIFIYVCIYSTVHIALRCRQADIVRSSVAD